MADSSDDVIKPLAPSASEHLYPYDENFDGKNPPFTPYDDPAEKRLKRIIYLAVGLLLLVVIALGVGLGLLFKSKGDGSSSSASDANAVQGGGASTSSRTATTAATAAATPIQSVYNYSNWGGGCTGCGAYGGYGGSGSSKSSSNINVFGTLANMTDPIDCNAWNIYFNLTITLDYTNGTSNNIGLRGPFIRALFHDAGTYNPVDGSGGMDGSLIHELTDRKDNLGLEKTATWVEELFSSQKAECSWLSRADIISMGAFIAMSSPNYTTPYYTGNSLAVTPIALPFLIGRVDTNTANPTGRLPASNQSATDVLTRFINDFGFTAEEAAAIVSASHSVGGVNIGGRHTDPPVGTQYQTFFLGTIDGPRAVVDNKAINRAIGGIALIPADNQMAKLPATASFMSNFNANLTALYAAYYPAALKMSLLGQNANAMRTWTPPLPL